MTAQIEISPNGRFNISNTPVNAPGHCAVCGSADSDRTYLDFGMQVEFFGSVYFCSHCFAEAAEAAGFVSVAKLEELAKDIPNPDDQIAKLEEEFREYRDAVRTILRNCDCDHGDLPADVPVGDSPAIQVESDSDDGNASEPELDDESGGSEGHSGVRGSGSGKDL